MIYGVTYANQRVSAADHAKLFRMVIGDGVMNGCGCSYRYDKFTISDGQFIACGRLTGIEGSEVIDITGNSGYARIRGVIDMDQAAEIDAFGQFYWRVDYASSADGFAALTQEDVNARGKIYEIEWAVVSLGEGGITGIVRSIANAEGGSGGGGEITYITESLFSFTNGQTAANYEYYGDGTENWEIALLDSGTFKFLANPGLIDVFIVGSGGTGSTGSDPGRPVRKGGDGGDGGECIFSEFVTVSRNNPYPIVVGENGGDSTAFEVEARGGTRSSEYILDRVTSAYYVGGTGAQANGPSVSGTNGKNGMLAFNNSDVHIASFANTLFGAGGGGGSAQDYNSGNPISRDGGAAGWTTTDQSSSSPYPRNAYGAGGTLVYTEAKSGRSNTGQGGGGGYNVNGAKGEGGKPGGSGIVIIRNHRSNPAA